MQRHAFLKSDQNRCIQPNMSRHYTARRPDLVGLNSHDSARAGAESRAGGLKAADSPGRPTHRRPSATTKLPCTIGVRARVPVILGPAIGSDNPQPDEAERPPTLALSAVIRRIARGLRHCVDFTTTNSDPSIDQLWKLKKSRSESVRQEDVVDEQQRDLVPVGHRASCAFVVVSCSATARKSSSPTAICSNWSRANRSPRDPARGSVDVRESGKAVRFSHLEDLRSRPPGRRRARCARARATDKIGNPCPVSHQSNARDDRSGAPSWRKRVANSTTPTAPVPGAPTSSMLSSPACACWSSSS